MAVRGILQTRHASSLLRATRAVSIQCCKLSIATRACCVPSISIAACFPRRSGSVLQQRMGYATGTYPSHVVINMPSLSPTMTQGTLVSWKVAPGSKISPGDELGMIETDKATMSFDCSEEGYIAKLLVPAGTTDVALGTPIMVLTDSADDVAKFADFTVGPASAPARDSTKGPASAPTPAAPSPAAAITEEKAAIVAQSSSPTPADTTRIVASPLAKRLAAAAGVLLNNRAGTGPNGRITQADVEAFISIPVTKVTPVVAPKVTPAVAVPTDTDEFIDMPLSNVRKVIASRLLESKTTIPHYYLSADIRVDELLALREELNSLAEKGSYKLSVNDFVIKASALAMKSTPEVNSSWQGTFIRQYKNVDISVAVSTENGLITPIVFGANQKGLATISQNVKDLAAKARENKLTPQEFIGGTFTISNLGMFGVKSFSAIINPPQSCILAVGASEKQVVVDAKGEMVVCSVMTVTLSCDHRVVDGAVGATWLKNFKNYLEKPVTMLL